MKQRTSSNWRKKIFTNFEYCWRDNGTNQSRRTLQTKGDLRQAVEFFGRAAKYSENENFDDLAARSYCDTGHVYYAFGKISTAKHT